MKLKYIYMTALAVMFNACALVPSMSMVPPDEEGEEREFEDRKVILKPIPFLLKSKSPVDLVIPSELLKTEFSEYKVGPFDVLQIIVWEHPELTQPLGNFRTDEATGQIVNSEGFMFYPFVGNIMVAGKTLTEVRLEVTKRLAKVLQRPQVDVKILKYRSQRVQVIGDIKSPGTYPITDLPMTLGELFYKAGGLLAQADGNKLLIVRNGKKIEIDYFAMLENGLPVNDVLLQKNDVVKVPSLQESNVFILGEVKQPGVYSSLKNNISLTQAIAKAGGFLTLSADAGEIYVIRNGVKGDIEVFFLDAESPVALAVGDKFPLKPRDLIFVDASGLARWKRVLDLILPSFSAIQGGIGTAADIKTLSN